MYLPSKYKKFSDQFSEVHQAYGKLGQLCRDSGPLSEKNQELVKLGIAIGVNSRGGVMSAVRKALSAGATPDELNHAILLSLTTTGFPNMIAAMGWADEVLDQQE